MGNFAAVSDLRLLLLVTIRRDSLVSAFCAPARSAGAVVAAPAPAVAGSDDVLLPAVVS